MPIHGSDRCPKCNKWNPTPRIEGEKVMVSCKCGYEWRSRSRYTRRRAQALEDKARAAIQATPASEGSAE